MHEKAVLDRIVDEEQAVLLVGEAEVERVVPFGKLPAGAREGSWLRVRFAEGKLEEALLDLEETERVTARIGEKLEKLRRRGRRRSDPDTGGSRRP